MKMINVRGILSLIFAGSVMLGAATSSVAEANSKIVVLSQTSAAELQYQSEQDQNYASQPEDEELISRQPALLQNREAAQLISDCCNPCNTDWRLRLRCGGVRCGDTGERACE
jgi:hypothetical protein